MSDSVSPSFGNALNVIGRAVADTPSPWDYARQYQDVQKNALDIQNVQAQQAVGEAYQNAIDPRTGTLDPNKFRQNLAAAGPTAALAAGTNLANVQNISNANVSGQLAKYGFVANSLAGLDGKKDLSLADVSAKIHEGVSLGAITPSDAAGFFSNIQYDPNNPAVLQNYIHQQHLYTQTPEFRHQLLFGSNVGVPTGTGTQYINVPPTGPDNAGRSLPYVQNYGSPQDWNTPRQYPDLREKLPDGSPNPNYMKPGMYSPAEVAGWLNIPTPPGYGTGPPNVNVGTGRPPNAALTNPNKPPLPGTPPSTAPATTTPPSTGAPGGAAVDNALAEAKRTGQPVPIPGIPGTFANPDQTIGAARPGSAAPATAAPPAAPPATAAPPIATDASGRPIVGASPSQTARAEEAPKLYQVDTQAGLNARGQLATLGTMLSDASRFAPGPGADTTKYFRQVMASWPGAAALGRAFGMDPDKISSQESFDKLVNQLVLAQGGATDQRMNVTEGATPSSKLTPQGVDLIIRQLQGNSDYLMAKGRMAANTETPNDYNAFTTKVQQLDPRVFQLNRMTDPQRQVYWKSLDSGAQDELTKAIQYWKGLRAAGQL